MVSMRYKLSDEMKRFLASKGPRSPFVRIEFRKQLRVIQREARKTHDFKSRQGNLERSIEAKIVNEEPLTGEVFINEAVAPYGTFVHEGTGVYGPKKKPYFVKPSEKKALRWSKGDKFFFSKGHKVMGQPADKFLDAAVEKKLDSVSKSLEAAIYKELSGE